MLGVCYYPEHWPKERWEEDARRMCELGISYVRIGEFAWGCLEPRPGELNWGWLDDALKILGKAGLKVVIGTPTAAPPRWLVDRYPEILPVNRGGQVRRFGSRRHYCFSSPVYRKETRRIVTLLAERYGKHPAVTGWQVDNEYGCHDTVHCYCPRCRKAFQTWLRQRYDEVEKLNSAWGTVFWSQQYRDFDEIELPNLTVARPNPVHLLDYYRFASDQVRSYNNLQVKILRRNSPGKFVTHNFEDFSTDFDHFVLAQDLDFATWDSYPLGSTDLMPLCEEEKSFYSRASHPDLAAFHHDLYRSIGRGRFWVMEQQPGPTNWAPHNPSPAPGMVRLWTWEALAHGAEIVSYFRWRQVPFAQEQMHAGLNRPDYEPDIGFFEVRQVAEELARLELPPTQQAPVALFFDYEADWVYKIQPQGAGWSYLDLVYTFYSVLRSLGLDIDIVPPGASLKGYRLVVVPSLPIVRQEVLEAFRDFQGSLVLGPRSGSKTENFQIPSTLPPGPLQELLPLKVVRVESLRPNLEEELRWDSKTYQVGVWKEWVESSLEPVARFANGKGAIYRHGNRHYLAFWPSLKFKFLKAYLKQLAQEAELELTLLSKGLRLRQRGGLTFAFNYAPHPQCAPAPKDAHFLLGGPVVEAYGISVWRV
ncbi:MAG: beta-galactosidase [candidate division WOR-3 bacterium]|nr:beta-galactosidase [candidate division WOR-3 bacterium]